MSLVECPLMPKWTLKMVFMKEYTQLAMSHGVRHMDVTRWSMRKDMHNIS